MTEAWKSSSDRWPVDQLLRAHGFALESRRTKPALWRQRPRSEPITQDVCLFHCLEQSGLFAVMLDEDGALHVWRDQEEVGHDEAAKAALAKLRNERRKKHPEVA